MRKALSVALSAVLTFGAFMPQASFAATTELTDGQINALTTPLLNSTVQVPDIGTGAEKLEAMLSGTGYTAQSAAPDNCKFKIDSGDTNEYILLRSVNADDGDGYFILANTLNKDSENASAFAPFYSDTENYRYDPDDSKSIASKLNDSDYISTHFPAMSAYIQEHTWYTEAIKSSVKVYSVNAKISLLSLTEYKANADRIGINVNSRNWMTRTPNGATSLWAFTPSGIFGEKINSTSSWLQIRPCFYVSEDFFKNVKIASSYITQDSEVFNIIKEFDADTLRNIGYTDEQLVNWGILKGSTEIEELSIEGDTQTGCEIKAVYNVSGGFEDASKTKFVWEWADTSDADESGWTVLENEDKRTLTVQKELNEKYIRVRVTLGNFDGMGSEYTSEPVYIKNYPPVIGNLELIGNNLAGYAVKASYKVIEGSVDESLSSVKWYFAPEQDGEYNIIDGATATSYTVDDSMQRMYIKAQITPVNALGIAGETRESEPMYIYQTPELEKYLSSNYKNDNKIDYTPDKYKFSVFGTPQEFILLKSINASKDDGYFVMRNDTVLANTKFYDSADSVFKFDHSDENSIAYFLNTDAFLNAQEASTSSVKNFPKEILPYINEHDWWIEGTKSSEPFLSKGKISLLSYTEYLANADRIGVKCKFDRQWFLRTPVGDNKNQVTVITGTSTSASFGNFAQQASTISYPSSRPVFYLSADFFKNVKISTYENSALAEVLKECMTISEMKDLGYTENELSKMGIGTHYPVVSGVAIRGNKTVGSIVYADYGYSHTGGEISEGSSVYKWYREENGMFTAIKGADDDTYTLTQKDLGKRIKLEITPFDENGIKGAAVSAVTQGVILPELDINVFKCSLDDVSNMAETSSVSAELGIKSSEARTVKCIIGIYDKQSGKCIAIKRSNEALNEGENTVSVSSGSFNPSENNFVRVFVLDDGGRPIFGTEYFKRQTGGR